MVATEFFAIDPLPYLESDLGIFVSDATKELEKLNLNERVWYGYATNGTPASTVADIVDSENFVMMKDKIKEAEKISSRT
jgi:fibrillarin-like rRNA methylase